jgi:hypothetical protein
MAGLTAAAAAYPPLTGQVVRAHWAPTWADWLPRTTAWTPVSVAVAVALLAAAPLASRLSWRWLAARRVAATWIWTMTLALVDGRSGIATTFVRPG